MEQQQTLLKISKPFRPTLFENGGLLSHGEAILGDLSELRDTPEVNLGAILQGDDDVTPLTNEPGHDLHVLDGAVGEVAAVLARQARDNRDPQVGEPVPEVEGPRHSGQGQGKP